ncbi:hypothetical protein CEXT_30961 [Caerostris extrusa]|uniref:Uncharacterized protein n=1 Tax=Caerostris extrusa TaxID=172846 RepID=A0AAV4WQ49_CAEEX|nr:hypothetical protein CEXT_30961 [Caerostris extrusa]
MKDKQSLPTPSLNHRGSVSADKSSGKEHRASIHLSPCSSSLHLTQEHCKRTFTSFYPTIRNPPPPLFKAIVSRRMKSECKFWNGFVLVAVELSLSCLGPPPERRALQ